VCLSSGHDTYFYQLFMDKDERVLLPTTQQLLELSFMQSDVKLSEVQFQILHLNCLNVVACVGCQAVRLDIHRFLGKCGLRGRCVCVCVFYCMYCPAWQILCVCKPAFVLQYK